MKRIFIITVVMLITFSMVTSCSSTDKDIRVGGIVNLSESSFLLTIKDARLTKDFQHYSQAINEVGIVLYGKVEKGMISENSQLLFADEAGTVLYTETAFKIEIVTSMEPGSQGFRSQAYAESGDDVMIYLPAVRSDDIEQFVECENALAVVRASHFAVQE